MDEFLFGIFDKILLGIESECVLIIDEELVELVLLDLFVENLVDFTDFVLDFIFGDHVVVETMVMIHDSIKIWGYMFFVRVYYYDDCNNLQIQDHYFGFRVVYHDQH